MSGPCWRWCGGRGLGLRLGGEDAADEEEAKERMNDEERGGATFIPADALHVLHPDWAPPPIGQPLARLSQDSSPRAPLPRLLHTHRELSDSQARRDARADTRIGMHASTLPLSFHLTSY